MRDRGIENLVPRLERLELRDAENAVYEQHPCEYPMKVYCEHGALTFAIKKLARSRHIELVHFPYDPDSHTRRISRIAEPSTAQIRDLNLPIRILPGAIGNYKGSEHSEEILSILGRENRRDALHVDSAFKSGCVVFITQDSDILKHKAQLQDLLGIRFFHPYVDLRDIELVMASDSEIS